MKNEPFGRRLAMEHLILGKASTLPICFTRKPTQTTKLHHNLNEMAFKWFNCSLWYLCVHTNNFSLSPLSLSFSFKFIYILCKCITRCNFKILLKSLCARLKFEFTLWIVFNHCVNGVISTRMHYDEPTVFFSRASQRTCDVYPYRFDEERCAAVCSGVSVVA